MSELVSIGILLGLAVWGFGCHFAGKSRDTNVAASTRRARARAKISVSLAFLALAVAVPECFGHAQTVPAPLKTGLQQIKSGLVRQSLNALRSLRFEPTADGAGMVSRSERRSLRVNPGGSVEIHSLVSGKPAEVELRLDGSNSTSAVTGSQALPSHSNYFLGNDQAKWRSEVAHFEQARVDGVYPGIDLLYYGNGEWLEHDYQLSPGADPKRIRMRIGGSVPRIDTASGDLVVSQVAPSTELLRLHKPVAYQPKPDGSRDLVAAAYQQNSDGSFSFSLGDYDRSRPLVIDPVITYSSYFGGGNDDSINDVKLDAAGNIYLLVQTDSVDLPVISQIAGACNGTCGPTNPGAAAYMYDFYLAKLDPTGQKLLFSTYIGGSQNDTPGELVIANDGTLYISGETKSADFPVYDQYPETLTPGNGVTVSTTLTRLSADGSKILYSTLIGGGLCFQLGSGAYINYGFYGPNGPGGSPGSLAVGPNGIAYLLGEADTLNGELGDFVDIKNSPNFTAGSGSFIAAFDTTKAGGDSLIYARTFGVPGDRVGDLISSIALDSKQNLWVSVYRLSGTQPTTTPDAVQPTNFGNNAYLFEVTQSDTVPYSTFLGGTMTAVGGVPTENAGEIYIDSADNIYLGGQTESIDFPTKNAAYTYSTSGGQRNPGYLTKLSPGGKSILYSTYLPSIDPVIAATADGMVAVAGTVGQGYPVVNGFSQSPNLGANGGYEDGGIALIDTTKSGTASLLSSGYLGSSGAGATPQALVFDAQENLVLAGQVYGALPVVDPYQSTCSAGCYAGNQTGDGFLTRIQYQAGKLTLTPATGSFPNTNVGSTSAPFTATLTNSTAQTITLSVPSLTDSTDFTATDNCNGRLASAASCNVTITFKPSTAGTLSSTYSIEDASQPNSPLTIQLSGVGVAVVPPATLAPTALNFGNVTVGSTSGVMTASLTNTSTASYQVSSITQSSSAIIVHTSYCARAVVPGAFCELEITVEPTATGAFTGSVVINYYLGDGSTPSQNVTSTLQINATGIAPAVTLTPASADFGSIAGGQTSPAQTFTVTNNYTTAVSLAQLTIAGPFTIAAGATCISGAQLPAGQSCSIPVVFIPTETGPTSGTLYFSYIGSSGGPISKTSSLTGTGTGSFANATLTPISYDFGNAAIGYTSNQFLFQLTNTGTVPLHPGGANLSAFGFQFPPTSATTCTGSNTLSPGASCYLAVAFSPTKAGIVTGTLSIPSEAGTKTATVIGTGVPLTATLTPATYNFGDVTVGSTSSQVLLKFTNTSLGPIHAGSATSTLPGLLFPISSATTCTGPSGGLTLEPGASCNLVIAFAPTTIGTKTGVVSIPSEIPMTIAILTGTGVAPTATLTPATYNFGNVYTGYSSSQFLLTLTNTSNIPLHTAGPASSSKLFVFPVTAATTCTDIATIAPGTSCTLAVEFSPTDTGTATGTISIQSEAGTKTATVTGTGVPLTATITPATYDFGDVIVGSTSSQVLLKFTNTSLVPLHAGNATGTLPGLLFPISSATTCTGTSGGAGLTLQPGASCNLVVAFAPKTVGTQTGVVNIPSEIPMTTALLTGTGVAPTPPPTLAPAMLSFRSVTVGATSAAQSVTFNNPATFPLTLESIGLTGSGFSIQAAGTTCKTGPAIAANGSCTLSIIFSPATAGAVSGSLTVGLPAGFAVSSLSVPLTGAGVAAVVSPETINFTSGFTSNGMTLNGAAAVPGNVLQLTANQPSQASSAFYPTAVSAAHFSTDFAFQLLDPLAEGITFTIQGDSPTAIGTNDGGLGYQGIAKSIAFKFDLRDTGGEGDDSTGIYVNGAPPTVPSTSLAASGIDLHSGDVFTVHLSYDGTTESITLMDSVTGAVWTTQAAEDIPGIIGSSQAFFGFTASTGIASVASASVKPAATAASTSVGSTANILYWAYSSQSDGVAALQPIQLSFGNVTLGSTSATQYAQLTNTGTAQFQVSSITPSDPSIVVHSSYCARPVTPGNYCKLEVTVAPTAAGAFLGTVVVNYYLGDGSTPAQNYTSTLMITATGVAFGVTLTPASADFGGVAGGTSGSPQIFTVTNNYATAVSLTRIETADSFGSAAYQVGAGATCSDGGQLSAGKSCTIPMTYTPENGGADSGSLYVSYLDLSNRAVTLTSHLTGTGTAGAYATLTPATYNFGNVGVGVTAAPVVFTLTNTGITDLHVGAVTVSNNSIFQPSLIGNVTVLPGATLVEEIEFTPASAGPSTSILSIVTDAGTKTAKVSGSGVGPTATLTPATYNFGNVGVGLTAAPVVFTLTNTGIADLHVGAATVTNSSIFQPNLVGNVTVLPGATLVEEIEFTPTSAGLSTGTLSIATDAGTKTATVSGTGVVPTATLSPATYNFGNVGVGLTAAPFVFTLTNTGAAELHVGAVTVSNSSIFQPNLVGNVTVAPGATLVEEIEFTPASAGLSTGTLSVVTDAGTKTATLSGTGVGPTATLTPAALDFGEVVNGTTSAIKTLTVTNNSVTIPFDILQSAFISTLTGPSGEFILLTSPALSSCFSQPFIAPGASCTFAFEFSPTTSVPASEQVSFALPTTTITSILTGTGLPTETYTPTIQFGKGFTADTLTMSGPATVLNGALQLTSGPSSAASSAFYPTAVPTASFNTNFTFQLLDPTAEGITFTIQGDAPNAVGSGGGGLGYQGIPKSIAIKFDLKDTAGEGTDSTGVYINGAAPTVPATSLASSGIDLHSGHVFNLGLTYDGTTMTINVIDNVTHALWATQVAEDIPTIIGSNVAYFGFTAGSGTPALTSDSAEIQRTTERAAISTAVSAQPSATSSILTWTYVAGKNTGTVQTINFPSLSGAEYGATPIKLAATATSGLPVSYTLTGPAKLSGSTLIITGAGSVTVTATQSGNATFAPAAPVERIVNVVKASLTVTANHLMRNYGAANPALTYIITGFVDGDTPSVVTGTANLSTTAVIASLAGTYPITFAVEALEAANYTLTYVPGTLTVLPPGASCTVIDYSKGFPATGLTLNGSAKVADGILMLTDGGRSEAGSAFFATPLPTTADFVTDVTFQLLNPNADGVTFVVQAAGPHALGEAGGGLGYAGIPRSVALKLDLHNNAGEGADSTGSYINGAYPSQPSISLVGSNVDLHSGHVFQLHIAYDGRTSTATLTDIVTHISLNHQFPGSIAEGIGSSSAYFGFTGATGEQTAIQEILTWTYSGGSGCTMNP